MDSSALSLKRLVADLYGAASGEPVLVIGGGPSAPAALERLAGIQWRYVISANDHGFKLGGPKPDLIFCKDHVFVPGGKERFVRDRPLMEPRMRSYGVPIVSAQYWADYRAEDWPIQGNSGMMAMALGAMMKGRVVAIGIDCFTGQTYFHDPTNLNVSLGRPDGFWLGRMRRLRDRLCGASIGAFEGPVSSVFGSVENSLRGTPEIPPIFHFYAGMQTSHVRLLRPVLDLRDKRTEAPTGYVLPVSRRLQSALIAAGAAEPVHIDSGSNV